MRHAQASAEAIVLLAALLAIMLLLVGTLFGVGTTSQATYDQGVMGTTIDDLVNAATVVWHQGEGARQRIFLQLPENVDSIVLNGSAIVIRRASTSQEDYSRSLDFNITGNLSPQRSGYWLTVERSGGQVVVMPAD